MAEDPEPPVARYAESDAAPERGADNRGVAAHILPNGEVRGSGAGAGGGGGREDPDTDDPTIATRSPDPLEDHPERGGDAPSHSSA